MFTIGLSQIFLLDREVQTLINFIKDDVRLWNKVHCCSFTKDFIQTNTNTLSWFANIIWSTR